MKINFDKESAKNYLNRAGNCCALYICVPFLVATAARFGWENGGDVKEMCDEKIERLAEKLWIKKQEREAKKMLKEVQKKKEEIIEDEES